MRTPFVLGKFVLLVIAMQLCMDNALVSQHLSDEIRYVVEPSCVSPSVDKPTLESQYYYHLSISEIQSDEAHLEIVIDGKALTQFHVSHAALPYTRIVGPFSHSGIGGSYHEYILRSLETTVSDTLYLSEVVCGYSTSNGLNRAGYYCNSGDYGVIAQTAPEGFSCPQLPEKTYVYVLIDRSSGLVQDKNYSGHFNGVVDLENYEIHAFATTFEESSVFINNIIIGEELDQNDLSFCFGLCGVFPVEVDCSSFDLKLEKKVREGFVHSIGDTVVYDIIVTNEGRVTAYNIVVADIKPDELIFETTLNPAWNADITSIPIGELAPGLSYTIPITLIVGSTGGLIELINIAEIIQASNELDKDVTAFDVDSKPDNNLEYEDDQDDETIIVIENLCDATFRMQLMKEPVCVGSPIEMSAMIEMSNGGLRYFWDYNGTIISKDSMLIIPNHSANDYGRYGLTVIDAMGCHETKYITIAPIDNTNRPSCFSDIYVGINEKCQMFLRPSMFTNRTVSAIDDYIIEIRDVDGQLVDQTDLWQYASGTSLEGRLINPCTLDMLCWSNLHIEHKARPSGNILVGDYKTNCAEVTSMEPTSILQNYIAKNPNTIPSKETYEDSLNQLSCLQEWDVEILDLYIEATSSCDNPEVYRIYSIYDQEQRVNLDTAILEIEKIGLSNLNGPEDVDNLSCTDGYDPQSLLSFPYYSIGKDTIELREESNGTYGAICQLGISYSDQYIGENCNFGINKIMRVWSVSDWCSNGVFQSIQFIYVVDDIAPEWNEVDTIIKEVAPFACSARVDVTQYINVRDECDQNPVLQIKGSENEGLVADYDLGIHTVDMLTTDRCGNKSELQVIIKVVENTAPAAILNQDIIIGMSEEMGVYTNYVLASHLDAGSHDHGCGPVVIKIARIGETSIIKSGGGSVSTATALYNCESDHSDWDINKDGRITISEVYRDRVIFCCQDIGESVPISVQVSDLSGNRTYVETNVEVQAKREFTNCDDGDPCTINDKAYGDCPCQGSLELRDEDADDIVDCQDEAIQFCLNDDSIIVTYSQIDSMLALGAIGGPCSGSDPMAQIAGAIYTKEGEMIEDVVVNSNYQLSEMTGENGRYAFSQNPMYQRYELTPYKNDDPLNGVSSRDLVILQEFLIGIRPISDPYIQIAADINSDGQITALDLVDLRKLLLGYETEFPSNDSWRFIIKDFEWDDIRNPYDFEEINVITSLDKDHMDEDWLGVKIGDLSGDVIANSKEQLSTVRANKGMNLNIQNRLLATGSKYKIAFVTDRKEEIKALQLVLKADGLSISGIQSQLLLLSPEHIALRDNDSELSLVWSDAKPLRSAEILFEIEVEALKDGRLSDMLSLKTEKMEALYYNRNLDEGNIHLNFIEEDIVEAQEGISKMYQNQPNPFNGETLIQFELPAAGLVRFEFYSVDGKSLHYIEEEYGEGNNALTIRPSVFDGYSGIIYYQMKYGNEQHTKTMVVNRD